MPPLDFPNTPAPGDPFASWQWDGTKWTSGAGSSGFLPLTGGTLAGPGNLTVRGGILDGAAGAVPAAGAMTLNANTVAPPAGFSNNLNVVGSDGNSTVIGLDNFGGGNPNIQFRRARGTAVAPTAVQNGDVLGYLIWNGRGATTYSGQANIGLAASENWTDTARGTTFYFGTTPAGGTAGVNSLVLAGNTATFSGNVNTGGNITIGSFPYPTLVLQKSNVSSVCAVSAYLNTTQRWNIALGDGTAETGGNVGDDFSIARYGDTGTYLGSPFAINRATGNATFSGYLAVNGAVTNLNGSATGNWPQLVYHSSGTTGGITGGDLWRTVVDNAGNFILVLNQSPAGDFSLAAANMQWYPNGNMSITGGTASKPGGGSWAATSGKALKKSIKPYTTGLAALVELSPVSYTYKKDTGYDPTIEYVGLVFEDTPIPEARTRAVLPNGDEVPALDHTPLMFILINAIKELTTRLEKLEGAKK